MSWASRSADNILPCSNEKNVLAAALKEWLYTGDMLDLEEPIENCQLCDHPDVRYQFCIKNKFNGNELLVGSECINKFEIKAIDSDGTILGLDDSRKKINSDRRYLVEEARKKRVINSLVQLSRAESDFDIESFITYLQDRGSFTPNQLCTIFWRFKEYNIEHKKTDYKFTIRRNREKAQIREMPDWKLKILWDSMSTAQKTWVKENTNYSD